MNGWIISGVLLVVTGAASAAQLQIPDRIVTRNDSLLATLKLDEPLEGQGQLVLTWTDSYGRTVAAIEQAVPVKGDQVPVALPLDRAAALQNFLAARLTVGQRTAEAPRTEFIVTPDGPWDDYEIVMYYPYRMPAQQKALRDIGITAGKISSKSAQTPDGGQRWYAYDYPFYCDQIATWFYAAYHTPAYNPKQKKLLEAKEAYAKDRSSKKPFCREPCFDDKDALDRALRDLTLAVKAQMRFRPLFYAHTDEGGVADLVSAWDFCFCPASLTAMREWLKGQYPSLEALNRQWETTFKSWDEVEPFTTDQMMARPGDNFSPWADHRAFMNQRFADVVKAGTQAVEKVDPKALAGLVGCQMPGAFGGYDYWLLANAMTAIEPYNIGNNREIWRSLAPRKPAMTTAFGTGDMEVWRLWHQMLHGDLGIIIYDEKNLYLDTDAAPTEMAREIAPTYKELTAGLAKLLWHMEPVVEPIAIHYSHPSVTAHWMFEARREGPRWVQRGSAAERLQSDFLRLRESCVKLCEDNLRSYRFAAYAQLENGEFDKIQAKVLILPQSIAMSQKECDAVRRFVERGGTAIADCRLALMDEHCRMLEKGRLDDLFGVERRDLQLAPGPEGLKPASEDAEDRPLEGVRAAEPGVRPAAGATAMFADAKGTPAVIVKPHGKGKTVYLNAVITDYHRWRLRPPQGHELCDLFGAMLADGAGEPPFEIRTAEGEVPHGIEAYVWRGGDLRILALHRNYQLRVSELGPPEYQKQDALMGDLKLKIDLPETRVVYDQRTGKCLGEHKSVTIDLAKYEPTVLALLPREVKGLVITADARARRGELLGVELKLDAPKVGKTHAFRVKLLGPDGAEIQPVTATILAPKGEATWQAPFAQSDPPGEYTLLVRDMATGAQARHKVQVQ